MTSEPQRYANPETGEKEGRSGLRRDRVDVKSRIDWVPLGSYFQDLVGRGSSKQHELNCYSDLFVGVI